MNCERCKNRIIGNPAISRITNKSICGLCAVEEAMDEFNAEV
jgi:hypothetical protein